MREDCLERGWGKKSVKWREEVEERILREERKETQTFFFLLTLRRCQDQVVGADQSGLTPFTAENFRHT